MGRVFEAHRFSRVGRMVGLEDSAHPTGMLLALCSLLFALCSPLSAQTPKAAERAREEYPIQLEPPSFERVVRVESEASLRERIRQDLRQRGERAEFPADISTEALYPSRRLTPHVTFVVPHAVCYNPLYFEDLNSERYGWDLGIFQPIHSAAKFYVDLAILPYNMGVIHPCEYECNPGYFLPGDSVPYYCYVPPWSWKGALLQTGAVVGGVAAFP